MKKLNSIFFKKLRIQIQKNTKFQNFKNLSTFRYKHLAVRPGVVRVHATRCVKSVASKLMLQEASAAYVLW